MSFTPPEAGSIAHAVGFEEVVVRTIREAAAAAGCGVRSHLSVGHFEADPAPEPGCLLVPSPDVPDVPLPVLVLASSLTVPTAVAAVRGGAFHVLEWPTRPDLLTSAMKEAIEADRMTRSRKKEIATARAKMERLTDKERQTLEQLRRGLSNREMAAELDLSQRAIEDRRARVMRRLAVSSVVELLDLVHKAEADVPALGIALRS